MEAPVYRNRAGEIIEDHREWPIDLARDYARGIPREVLFEPLNPMAEKIVHYRARYGEHSFCPDSPWLMDHERFFLPAIGALGCDREVIVPRVDVLPWAARLRPPRYRVTKSLNFGYLQQFWEGSRVNHMGWPDPEWGLEPDDAQAESVIEYFEKYRNLKYRGLLAAPFDVLSGEVFLPELEDAREAA